MRTTIIFALVAASQLAACGRMTMQDEPSRGLAAVNEPVIARTDFAYDLQAPGGYLPEAERARLAAWFSSLALGYGDSIHLDGANAAEVRDEVARIAGRHGLTLSGGVPITPGALAPDAVRVVVSRTRAMVPGCPNWSEPSSPNYHNRTMSNFGCAVNGNLAAMVANPTDLIQGRGGDGVTDTLTSSKAIDFYRSARPTGEKGLQDTDTKKED